VVSRRAPLLALRTRHLRVQRIPGEDPIFNRPVLHEMLLDKPRNAVGGHAVIPGSLRIHQHGRPVTADAQAADLGSITGVRAGAEIAILDLCLERFPSGLAHFRRAAVRAGAEKDVPAIAANANFGGGLPQLFIYFRQWTVLRIFFILSAYPD